MEELLARLLAMEHDGQLALLAQWIDGVHTLVIQLDTRTGNMSINTLGEVITDYKILYTMLDLARNSIMDQERKELLAAVEAAKKHIIGVTPTE